MSIRAHVVAVAMVCPRGHRVGEVRPVPEQGPVTAFDVVRLPTRYRSGHAAYITGDEYPDGWVKLPELVTRLSREEFESGSWGVSATWACRCGLQSVSALEVLTMSYAWSADRQRRRGGPTPPRMVVGTRR